MFTDISNNIHTFSSTRDIKFILSKELSEVTKNTTYLTYPISEYPFVKITENGLQMRKGSGSLFKRSQGVEKTINELEYLIKESEVKEQQAKILVLNDKLLDIAEDRKTNIHYIASIPSSGYDLRITDKHKEDLTTFDKSICDVITDNLGDLTLEEVAKLICLKSLIMQYIELEGQIRLSSTCMLLRKEIPLSEIMRIIREIDFNSRTKEVISECTKQTNWILSKISNRISFNMIKASSLRLLSELNIPAQDLLDNRIINVSPSKASQLIEGLVCAIEASTRLLGVSFFFSGKGLPSPPLN